jgi:hypothetical protein
MASKTVYCAELTCASEAPCALHRAPCALHMAAPPQPQVLQVTEMAVAQESKKQYVVKCERQIDRIGLTFQFERNGEVTWWHRRQDFEEVDGEAAAWWIKAVAGSYELCAERLVRPIANVVEPTVPNISMGDLQIETSPTDGMASIKMSYYNCGMRRPVLEAHYSYKIPVAKLAAAFTEAAAVVRKAESGS